MQAKKNNYLCVQDPEECQSRGFAGGAAHEIRVGNQLEHGEASGFDSSTVGADEGEQVD
jgi:hypothetical protein